MNMDDIDDLIKLLMDGEDLDDDVDLNKFKRNHVKIKFYDDDDENVKNDNLKKTNPYMSSEDIIKNRTNKPNRGFEGGISKSGKFKDFHPFDDLKVEKAIYRPEAQKANHKVNNQLNGSYKDLATVKDGVNAVKQILDQAMIVLNDLEEKLKNV